MSANATIRDLRNHFPTVRRQVESEGEVIISDNGQPRYVLRLYETAAEPKADDARTFDYLGRMRRRSVGRRPLTETQVRNLFDHERGA